MEREVLEYCQIFNSRMEMMHKRFVRNNTSLPARRDSVEVAGYFWALCNTIEFIVANHGPDDCRKQAAKKIIADTTGKWLFKSQPFWVSYFKPYGYTGDFSIIEMMYDLERHAGAIPYQSAMANCLDYAFATIDSVKGVWERRKWLHGLLLKKYEQKGGQLRVLDVACGGARYIRDFLDSVPSTKGVRITLVDQDPAAMNFVQTVQLKDFSECVEPLTLPISKVKKYFMPETNEYDVIISSGLFDYLNTHTAQGLLEHFVQLLGRDGSVAITNFSTEDRSAFAKEWFGDWQLIYRNSDDMKGLFPQNGSLVLNTSDNRSLIMAEYNKMN